MRRIVHYLIGLLLLLAAYPVGATHIVGGEVTYQCLGGNNYRVEIDIYQDCINGLPGAIQQDNPAYIGIFNGNGNLVGYDSIDVSSSILVPTNFNNSCVNNPPPTCLRKTSFVRTYNLPPNSSGYYIVYQRCCRNETIQNIYNPGSIGATYYCVIPPSTVIPCNNSAIFKNYPPQIICINNPLVYDHSATDVDGDSLSYEFCTAYQGANGSNPKPFPSGTSFVSVPYVGGYDAAHPMHGYPQLQINPTTGMITGTPNQTGRFVVTVCCNEWRNHVLINTVKREFQFVVTNCSKAVVANIPQYSQEFNTYTVQCKNTTVHFDNLSTGGFSYHWDFGVPGINTDTSSDFSPTYTYPDSGIYVVSLAVNRGSTCPDSITRLVKVYPEFHGGYTYSGLLCPHTPIQFTDLSTSTYKPINSWTWIFDDGTTSNDQNPVHIYQQGNEYKVTLISKNIKGCVDTVTKELDVERFRPFAGNDTIIVKGEIINFKATGGIYYTWTPSTHLNNPNIANPTGYYPDTTRIGYNVHIKSEVGCEGDDSIYVWVVNQGSVFVPSAFTPNGDGRNDVLRPVSVGYAKVNYFRVFNRWGEQMFYTVYINQGWDGTHRGKPADIGVYMWELSITDRFGREEKYKGDATLLR